MRIFVTGATGWVGSAVVQELIGAGYQVLGLTRSESGAQALAAAGAEVHHGSLEDLDSLRRGAELSDGVIHTAFNHDFSKFQENCAAEERAVQTLGAALEGSDRPLIVTSGVGVLTAGGTGRLITENDTRGSAASTNPRVVEETTDAMAARGVKTSIVRLAPSVHGAGDHGFVPVLIGMAREKGVSAYLGEGLNRWPGVHRLDAARLYRLALEKGESGARYHAIAEEGVSFRNIADAIGKGLNLPVVSKSPAEAAEHFTWFAMFAAMDCPSSSAITCAKLGWEPTGPLLLPDMEANYFSN